METIFAAKESRTISSKEELAAYFLEKINNTDEEMSQEEKEKIETRIMAKLKRGKKLTAKEMEYLRKNNPVMYMRALRIQKMAEAVKEQLKHAKSKQQADSIVCQALGGISDKDPDKEYIVAAINEVAAEFRKSGAYNRLPNTDEDARKLKNRVDSKNYPEEWDDEKKEDLFSWTPLQEVIDAMPSFNVNA